MAVLPNALRLHRLHKVLAVVRTTPRAFCVKTTKINIYIYVYIVFFGDISLRSTCLKCFKSSSAPALDVYQTPLPAATFAATSPLLRVPMLVPTGQAQPASKFQKLLLHRCSDHKEKNGMKGIEQIASEQTRFLPVERVNGNELRLSNIQVSSEASCEWCTC